MRQWRGGGSQRLVLTYLLLPMFPLQVSERNVCFIVQCYVVPYTGDTNIVIYDLSCMMWIEWVAFLVLGFYVQAAFARYNSAGQIWVNDLRSGCHALAAQSFSLFEDGTLHEGDQLRMVAHIAALPLVLKNELRGSRDVREIKGLLSYDDMARIQCAESMASHCVDVIRSYFIALISRKDLLSKNIVFGNRVLFYKVGILGLERLIRSLKFLRSFDIAPGFVSLLNILLGIWFAILPFAIAEICGTLVLKRMMCSIRLICLRYTNNVVTSVYNCEQVGLRYCGCRSLRMDC